MDPLGLEESDGETVFGKDNVFKKAGEAVSKAWGKARDFFKNNQSGRAVADVAGPVVKDAVEVGAAALEATVKHDSESLNKLERVATQKVSDVPEGVVQAVTHPGQTLRSLWNPDADLQYNLTKAAVLGLPLVFGRGKDIVPDESSLVAKTTTVTSWADKGITPDLNPGRWVMKGEATKWNFWKSGLPGPKVVKSGTFPYFRVQKSKADFSNFITDDVPTSSLNLPPGTELIKAPLGQRVLGESDR